MTSIDHDFKPLSKSAARLCAFALLLALSIQTSATNLPLAPPASVGMSARQLARIDTAVADSITKKELPGAVVLVARRGRVVWRKAYGSRAVLPERETMTADTIFDLASLTKVVATATSIMMLVERGQLRLSDPASLYLPELKGESRDRITIEQLLLHRSGYAPDFDLSEKWSGYGEAMKRLASETLRNPPDTRFVYSDINYIALGEVVHRVSGMTLDEFARKNIYEPLGMKDTGFRPFGESTSTRSARNDAATIARIAPTETRRAAGSYLGGVGDKTAEGEHWLRGEVHDPTSFRMGGVAGHAGLFSTADDLAIYCQMILNGGEYKGVRIMSPLTVA